MLGCFAMGCGLTGVAGAERCRNDVRLFLTTGILGGFTTFSAFSLDIAKLVQR